MNVLTAEQAKNELERRGVSVTEWSKAHNLNPGIVFHLLNGKVKGRRGAAHRAAVLLGMKEGEITTPRQAVRALDSRDATEGVAA